MSDTHPHIVIIDDDAYLLELMRTVLEEETYRVTTMDIAFENVTDIEELQPDLLFLDLLLHGQPAGWTLLHTLKRYHRTKDIPLIICTAMLPHAHTCAPLLAQYALPLLKKPFALNTLLHMVQQTLSSSPLHCRLQ